MYTVTLKRDGSVKWQGTQFVQAKGARTGKADLSETRALFELIAKSCYLSMDSEYAFGPTDHPWANTILATSQGQKRVQHYAPDDPSLADSAPENATPPQCVAPDALTKIENQIDAVAHTSTWIAHPVLGLVIPDAAGHVLWHGTALHDGTLIQLDSNDGPVDAQIDSKAGPQFDPPKNIPTPDDDEPGQRMRLSKKTTVVAGIGIAAPDRIVKCGDARCVADPGGHILAHLRQCFTVEGMHLTAWEGIPLKSRRIFHAYHSLGYDIDPSGQDCRDPDYKP